MFPIQIVIIPIFRNTELVSVIHRTVINENAQDALLASKEKVEYEKQRLLRLLEEDHGLV